MAERREDVQVGEHRIHTRVWDAAPGAPDVVLVHGFVISSRYMVPLGRALAGAFRVWAPDLPGYGRSSKPTRAFRMEGLADLLAAWMDAVSLATAHLVGNSMGCQVAAAFAQRHPERVDRLVLIGPTTDRHARTVPRQAWRLFRDIARERWTLPFIHVPDYLRTGIPRALQTLEHTMSDRIEERLPAVRAPTLLVRGERDSLVSERFADELLHLLPDGKLVVLPGAPHASNFSAATEAARIIVPFLQGDSSHMAEAEMGEA